jgi:hypothetical protein
MAFCINCGYKIENDEMICLSCGTNMSKLVKKQGSNYSIKSNFVVEIINSIAVLFKGIFSAPIATTIKCSKELTYKTTFTLVMFLSLIFSAICTGAYAKLISVINRYWQTTDGAINNGGAATQSSIYSPVNMFKLSYDKVFLLFFTAFLISIFLMVILAYIVNKFAIKNSTSFLCVLNAIVCASIYLIAALGISLLISWICMPLVIIPIILGVAVSNISLYCSMNEVFNIDKEKSTLLVSLFNIIVCIIVGYTFNKLLIKSVDNYLIKQLILQIVNMGMTH